MSQVSETWHDTSTFESKWLDAVAGEIFNINQLEPDRNWIIGVCAIYTTLIIIAHITRNNFLIGTRYGVFIFSRK